MATVKDVVIGQLNAGQTLIQMLIGDLSDAEYFQSPFDGANHVGWILGHLACSDDSQIARVSGESKQIPESLHQILSGESTCSPGASGYPSRSEIDELFRKSGVRAVELLSSFDESKWDDPSPDGVPNDFFPTVGAYLALLPAHHFWHIGQMTTCRLAMGKKRVLS